MATYYENSNDIKVRDILDSKRSNERIDFTIMCFLLCQSPPFGAVNMLQISTFMVTSGSKISGLDGVLGGHDE